MLAVEGGGWCKAPQQAVILSVFSQQLGFCGIKRGSCHKARDTPSLSPLKSQASSFLQPRAFLSLCIERDLPTFRYCSGRIRQLCTVCMAGPRPDTSSGPVHARPALATRAFVWSCGMGDPVDWLSSSRLPVHCLAEQPHWCTDHKPAKCPSIWILCTCCCSFFASGVINYFSGAVYSV